MIKIFVGDALVLWYNQPLFIKNQFSNLQFTAKCKNKSGVCCKSNTWSVSSRCCHENSHSEIV